MHVDSSQVQSILNPVRGVRDAQIRAGITPVNHSRHNVQAVKEQSRLNMLRKAQAAEEAVERERAMLEGRPVRSKPPTPAGTRRTDQASAGALSHPSRRHSAKDPGVRDFVHGNRIAAAAAARPVKAAARREPQQEYLTKRDYGRVPQYLLERKMQMTAEYEAQLAAKEVAMLPAGMRVLPEEERQETLALLARNRAEVEKQLGCLPIIIETASMVRRKDELERRLHEIDDATRVFSRPKVLVRAV